MGAVLRLLRLEFRERVGGDVPPDQEQGRTESVLKHAESDLRPACYKACNRPPILTIEAQP